MTTPLRVLIIEDSENDAELLLLELRRGGYAPEYERVESPRDWMTRWRGNPGTLSSPTTPCRASTVCKH